MAYIKIDTDKMQTVINNIIDYSHAVDGARSAIRRSSEYHHDPVESVVTDTESLPLALAPAPGNKTMWAYVMRLRDLAEELRSRRQEAIDINESGITMANPDGTLSYYLPDPPPGTQDEAAYWRSMDTVDNVHAYNTGSVETAKAEAAELQEALENGTSSQGRTPEQILDQIDKHRDIPTYSLAFCQTMGVDSMLDAPLEAQKDTNYAQESQPAIIDRMVDTFGHIMCAASTLYDAASYQPSASSPSSPHQYSLASAIYNAVTDKGHEGRATVLDAYLTADGTVYDADFLVGLAELMETIEDWPAEPKGVRWSGQYGTDDYGNKYLPDHTTDPLAAVLNGMARNTEASLAYLAPDDWDTEDGVWLPSEKSKKRMEMLANRVWTDLSMEGLSGVFAAASASRSPSGQAAGSNQANEVSQRATWATANGITILEAQGLPNFGQTKHNVGIMLGNCGRELIGIATNGSISPGESPAFPGTQITLAGSDEESLKNAIAHLLYEVSDSSEANYEIARGTTAYTASRTSTYMTENDPSISAIQAFYKQQADVMNLLALLGQEKADNAYNGAMAASSLLSLVPGLGTPATLASAGLTLSGAPQVDVTRHAGDTGLLGAAYTNAFNAGLINNPPDPNTTSWYSVDPNGSQRVTLETDEQVADFNTWISTGAGDTPDAMNNLTNSSIAMGTQNWSDPDAFKDAYGGEDW
ncbi:DUF6571 family protein [Actinomyces ruminicola]|uniref:DUF6571 domain-containing protein n=1 Tax=Actinomyces ruminicola TaxID=332524 RepID=A0A1G9V2H7_9ACTO|nr:DUF6571 family protein [Actinomyces ruminicola]SDM66085.1 hypothetical protein SAMN04487766_10564 [Actinomyces ruminicola]